MKPLQSPEYNRDPLQAFVVDNREAFDNEAPPASVWDAIARDLPSSEAREVSLKPTPQPERVAVVRRLVPFWRQAAVACMLITIGLLGGMLLAGDRDPIAGDDTEVALTNRITELERFYERELDRRMRLVASYAPEAGLRRELASMTQLEVSEDPAIVGADPAAQREVLEAMAQEYQAKLDALEHVLGQLRKADAKPSFYNEPSPRSHERL